MTTPTVKTADFVPKIKKGACKAAPRIVLVGVEGVGKTTAGAQCPDPIFLCAEDGLVGYGLENVPYTTPENWNEALRFLNYIATGDHPYKSLIVDTLDWLEPLLFSFICKRDKKESIEDYGFGKGYIMAIEEFRRFIAGLELIRKRGILVMINAHCQIKSFNNPIGDNFDRYELKASKQLAGLVKEWADVVLFARYEIHTVKDGGKKSKAKGVGGQKRIVHTEHSAGWDAKNRYGLPVTMVFDMPEILEAMKQGKPDTPENIIAEINSMLPNVPEAKQAAITAFIEANKTDAIKLSQTLNRVRVLAEEAE
jgi:hypothetical protein